MTKGGRRSSRSTAVRAFRKLDTKLNAGPSYMSQDGAQDPNCPQCGAELIGDEELEPALCLLCQRGIERAVAVEELEEWVPIEGPADPAADLCAQGPPTCPDCDGAKGRIIVTLADGEIWRNCAACRGRGIIPT